MKRGVDARAARTGYRQRINEPPARAPDAHAIFRWPTAKERWCCRKTRRQLCPSSISELPNDHSFVWDADLVKELEQAGARVPRGAGDKQANKKVAQENYRLCAEGGYQDIHGKFHMLQLPKGAINTTHRAPRSPGVPTAPRHKETRVAVARVDTATATRDLKQLGYGRVAALNFANAFHPGGGYVNGARAQEEDLCRLIPTLFGSLKKLKYPIKEYEAHYTQGWLARSAGTYSLDDEPLLVDIVSSAMPDLGSAWNKIRLDSEEWHQTVRTRMRAVLHAAGRSTPRRWCSARWLRRLLNLPEAVAPSWLTSSVRTNSRRLPLCGLRHWSIMIERAPTSIISSSRARMAKPAGCAPHTTSSGARQLAPRQHRVLAGRVAPMALVRPQGQGHVTEQTVRAAAQQTRWRWDDDRSRRGCGGGSTSVCWPSLCVVSHRSMCVCAHSKRRLTFGSFTRSRHSPHVASRMWMCIHVCISVVGARGHSEIAV